MFSHTAYGLTLHSEVELAHLRPGGDLPDVLVRLGPVPLPPEARRPQTPRWLGGAADDVTIFWRSLISVRIRGGREVTLDPCPGVGERELRTIVTGSVMGVLLLQRTPSVFHASVGVISGGAVAFLARKGQGKSTMAAALHARGHEILSDDLLVVDESDGVLSARAGVEEMKLWPDVLEALGDEPGDLARVLPTMEKRARPLGARGLALPAPLRRVYLLTLGSDIRSKRLESEAAFIGVIPHWYGAQFEGDLLPLLDLEDQLIEGGRLVRRVPVHRLTRPPDLTALDAVTRCIEQDMEE